MSSHAGLTLRREIERKVGLIETAKINGVEPFAYLQTTREAIPNAPPRTGSTVRATLELPAVKLNSRGSQPPLTMGTILSPCARNRQQFNGPVGP